MYLVEVQAKIDVQVGEFLKINDRAVDKHASETSCKKSLNVQDFDRCSVK